MVPDIKSQPAIIEPLQNGSHISHTYYRKIILWNLAKGARDKTTKPPHIVFEQKTFSEQIHLGVAFSFLLFFFFFSVTDFFFSYFYHLTKKQHGRFFSSLFQEHWRM